MLGNKIVFDTWAETWQQGCLLGNGFMGQVVYGRPDKEIVDLSHVAFFSGSGNGDLWPEKGAEAFDRARKAALRGDHKEVYRQTGKMMGRRGNYGTNLPVGKLSIEFGEQDISGYERVLDLDRGIASCRYESSRGYHERKAFTSHADHVFVYRLVQTREDMVYTVAFDGGRNPFRTWTEDGLLCFSTQALETIHSDGTEGARLCGAVKVCGLRSSGKEIIPEETILKAGVIGLRMGHVRQSVIYLAMEAWAEEDRSEDEVLESVKTRVNRSLEDYVAVQERHCADVESLMGRQKLKFGNRREQEAGLCVDEPVEYAETNRTDGGKILCAKELVELARKDGENRRLTELMYQYGRYLLMSSSRQDSPLPAHLQGVWNDDVACRIGWTCDMHLDINTQMNYWISEPGNLRECHEPLFNWMEQRLIPNGRITARKCYGYLGWVGELVSNAWGYAAPYWNESLSPCPTGGIWQASDYMEHYRYGQDKDFLRERALPVLKEAVSFFLEYLFEDEEGYLMGGPSISPENAFLEGGEKYFSSVGCTYEMVMIRELFLQYVEICSELGSGEDSEAFGELFFRVKEALPKLLPYRVLKDGTLAEWNHDQEAADPQHRHTSHLLGLFPYSQITPESTPELARAAAASIRAKLTPYENWEDTGWARSMLTLYSARLRDGEQAYHHLMSMQTLLTGPNLLVMHPPTRGAGSFMEVYELDGNTGFSMAVVEMLLQSHEGFIRLLPALPEAWLDGKMDGIVARGGIVVDLCWEQGRPVEVIAVSEKDRDVVFVWEDERRECQLTAGCRICLHF